MKKKTNTIYLTVVFLLILSARCPFACALSPSNDIQQHSGQSNGGKGAVVEVKFNSPKDDNRLIAFPTAEGYGKYATGGRGGDVYIVTNLNDTGAGSLRQGLKNNGKARTIVFAVSGTIELKSKLKVCSNTTIAGQTAPGDGICLKNYALNIDGDNVIVRFIRSRLGDEYDCEDDAINARYHKNIIIDHCSASWSIDETMSIYHCDSVTIQWCICAESLFKSSHAKGAHGFGGVWGNNYSTYHHNLLASHSSRNPRFASGCGYNDYRNNVIFNWGYNSCYGGEKYQSGQEATRNFTIVNMVANYYKPGPATNKGAVSSRIVNPSYSTSPEDNYGQWYVDENVVEGSDNATRDNWSYGVDSESIKAKMRLTAPWDAMSICQQSAVDAYLSVLDSAGCIFPKRDAVDIRIVSDVRKGTCTYGGAGYTEARGNRLVNPSAVTGIIDSPNDVGGWPELHSLPAPTDSDKDGMPDEWETAHGLDPHNATDHNKTAPNGYTYLECYLNSLVTSEGNSSRINSISSTPSLKSMYKYDLTEGVFHLF